MLRKLKLRWLAGNRDATAPIIQTQPEASTGARVREGGFWQVLDAHGLLDTPERRKLIRILRENCPFSEKVLDAWWIEPLQKMAVRVQGTPATWTGAYSHQGGFVDLSLNVAVRAVRLVRGMMLPPGATPEEQAEQSSAWVCAVYWAALFHHLGWLSGIEGGVENGQPWYPGMSVPAGAWRIRRAAGDCSSMNAIYMASRLLPESGIFWLQRWPALSEALFIYLSGAKSESGILNSIVADALSGCGLESNPKEAVMPVNNAGILMGGNRLKSDDISPKISDIESVLLSSQEGIEPSSEVMGINKNQYDSDYQGQPESAVLDKDNCEVIPSYSESATEPLALISAFENSEEISVSAEQSNGDSMASNLSAIELLGVLDQQMMGRVLVDSSAPVHAAAESDSKPENITEAPQNEVPDMGTPDSSGAAFFEWLKRSVDDGTVTVNENDSLLHVLAGYVFMNSPDCFYRFIATLPEGNHDKSQIQKSFEGLNIHHLRNGKGLYHYHKYDAPDKTGRFTKMSGYMILPGIIFKQGNCPKDSIWLSPKN
ncbi:TraI domain-containing protein [Raoultella terrigena]|uniref:TraI domain-containing protein n=1 Tax=Raoultella terrigena TaxID=577 RepID=UPI001F51C7E2|nr:TraI domain-containing protein [Raoultella terrigena]MCI1034843.1 TraI domain-containing protein [Raoultella terrigena]